VQVGYGAYRSARRRRAVIDHHIARQPVRRGPPLKVLVLQAEMSAGEKLLPGWGPKQKAPPPPPHVGSPSLTLSNTPSLARASPSQHW
jgi:hypothetical protein